MPVAGSVRYNVKVKGTATRDNLFILDDSQARAASNHRIDLKCIPTNYAIAQGMNTTEINGIGYCYWWLRNNAISGSRFEIVTASGNLDLDGNSVNYSYGIRPAMWLDLDGEPIRYLVTFQPGAVSKWVEEVNAGDTLTKPDDPVKEGLSFEGWFYDSSFNRPYDFNTEVIEDFTLYGKFVKEESVSEE